MAKKPAEKAAAKVAKDTEKAAAKVAKPAVTEGASDEVYSVRVSYINPEVGLTEREFSLETHGDDFKAIAEQFAQKFNGTIL